MQEPSITDRIAKGRQEFNDADGDLQSSQVSEPNSTPGKGWPSNISLAPEVFESLFKVTKLSLEIGGITFRQYVQDVARALGGSIPDNLALVDLWNHLREGTMETATDDDLKAGIADAQAEEAKFTDSPTVIDEPDQTEPPADVPPVGTKGEAWEKLPAQEGTLSIKERKEIEAREKCGLPPPDWNVLASTRAGLEVATEAELVAGIADAQADEAHFGETPTAIDKPPSDDPPKTPTAEPGDTTSIKIVNGIAKGEAQATDFMPLDEKVFQSLLKVTKLTLELGGIKFRQYVKSIADQFGGDIPDSIRKELVGLWNDIRAEHPVYSKSEMDIATAKDLNEALAEEAKFTETPTAADGVLKKRDIESLKAHDQLDVQSQYSTGPHEIKPDRKKANSIGNLLAWYRHSLAKRGIELIEQASRYSIDMERRIASLKLDAAGLRAILADTSPDPLAAEQELAMALRHYTQGREEQIAWGEFHIVSAPEEIEAARQFSAATGIFFDPANIKGVACITAQIVATIERDVAADAGKWQAIAANEEKRLREWGDLWNEKQNREMDTDEDTKERTNFAKSWLIWEKNKAERNYRKCQRGRIAFRICMLLEEHRDYWAQRPTEPYDDRAIRYICDFSFFDIGGWQGQRPLTSFAC